MNIVRAAIIAFATLALVTPALAGGDKECNKTAKKADKTAGKASTDISVADAAKLSKAGKVVMIDANGDNVRKEQGVVPGARLLASYSEFNAESLKVSKSDTLVFYCYNQKCGAAPTAAKMARKQGFKAKVMHAGIIGWKKAGQPVKKI